MGELVILLGKRIKISSADNKDNADSRGFLKEGEIRHGFRL